MSERAMEWTTAWKQQGIEEGRREGLQQGRQQGLEEGLQQGLRLGLLQKAREDVLFIAKQRFGMLPAAVREAVEREEDLTRLNKLLGQAALAPDLESFVTF
ncbi:MAG: Yae1 family protein [Caldilineales bacterium]|nr:Yae1 family protein [Caldilineales bacterium]